MRIAHLTTVDMSLRYLLLPQLEAALELGESIGISAPGPFVPDLEILGIRHISIESSTRSLNLVADVRAMRELWNVLRKERPDVLHTHNPKPGVYGRILGRLAGVPIVVNTVHGLYATEESSRLKRMVVYLLEWLAAHFSDAELVQNPEDLDLLRRLGLVGEEKLQLLGNGVDLSRFVHSVSARRRLRGEWGVSDTDVVVGVVARLVNEKGIPELVEAATRLQGKFAFVVVGPYDDAGSDRVAEAVLAQGEQSGVRFLGMKEDLSDLYSGFDIFALPSHREGMPRAAMEAASTGLPLVASNIRGCRQVVEDGVNGLLFERGDVDGLIAAIEQLGSQPGLLDLMGEASRKKAEAEFDERRVVETVMATYRRVAEDKGLGWTETTSSS